MMAAAAEAGSAANDDDILERIRPGESYGATTLVEDEWAGREEAVRSSIRAFLDTCTRAECGKIAMLAETLGMSGELVDSRLRAQLIGDKLYEEAASAGAAHATWIGLMLKIRTAARRTAADKGPTHLEAEAARTILEASEQ